MCVLTPTSGEGKVLGYDLKSNPEKIKSKIGYMSQKFSLYEDLTIEENLTFYGEIYSIPKERLKDRIEEIIVMLNLNEKRGVLSKNLSGGWKQRLALGCAIIHKPELLILDEPTAGVDPVARREFWTTIKDLIKDGDITVLATTHYMDEASLCESSFTYIINTSSRLSVLYFLYKFAGVSIVTSFPSKIKPIISQTEASSI